MPADAVRRLAHDLASAPSAAVHGRMGVSTQAHGVVCQWAVQAINVLTGNLDRPGGTMFTTPAVDLLGRGVVSPGGFGRRRSRVRGLPGFAGEAPVSALLEEMTTPGEGQVRGLLTIAGNPVSSTPGGHLLDRRSPASTPWSRSTSTSTRRPGTPTSSCRRPARSSATTTTWSSTPWRCATPRAGHRRCSLRPARSRTGRSPGPRRGAHPRQGWRPPGPLVPCDPEDRGPAAGQPATPGGRPAAVVGARLSVAKARDDARRCRPRPLKPRLPERLRTPEQRIDLLPAIVADALPDVLEAVSSGSGLAEGAPAHRAAAPARQQLLAAQRLAPDPRPGPARADAHPTTSPSAASATARRSWCGRRWGGARRGRGDRGPHAGRVPPARLRARARRGAPASRHRAARGVGQRPHRPRDVVEPVSGNAVLNGVPVTVEPLAVAVGEEALAGGRPTRPSRSRRGGVVTPDDARALALGLPDVVELPHHGFPSRTGRGGASSRRCRPRTSCG